MRRSLKADLSLERAITLPQSDIFDPTDGFKASAMCYSAMVVQSWRTYTREYGAHISIRDFARLYGHKPERRSKTPKAMDANLLDPQSEEQAQIRDLILAQNKSNLGKWEQELFKQRKRLADAERHLASGKVTKKPQEDHNSSVICTRGWTR